MCFGQYVKHGLPADLVEASKRHRLADEEFERNSIEGLAMTWAEALALEGRHSPDDDIEAIKKVTVADVNRVARKYLNLDRAITAIVTPEESGKPVSSASYGGHESFASSEKGNVPLPDWAEAQLARLPVPAVHVASRGHDAHERTPTHCPNRNNERHGQPVRQDPQQPESRSRGGAGRRGPGAGPAV